MVIGLESFAKWFQGHENEYAIIGGAACDLLMSEGGLDFRATINPREKIGRGLIGDLSSLSAILLDDEYYKLLCNGRTMIDGITILDAGYLILFKAKAWLDLSLRKTAGEHVDSKNLRKHKNDIFRLSTLLGRNLHIPVSAQIMNDFQSFLHAMREEQVDVKQLGLSGTKEKILERLETTYYIEENF